MILYCVVAVATSAASSFAVEAFVPPHNTTQLCCVLLAAAVVVQSLPSPNCASWEEAAEEEDECSCCCFCFGVLLILGEDKSCTNSTPLGLVLFGSQFPDFVFLLPLFLCCSSIFLGGGLVAAVGRIWLLLLLSSSKDLGEEGVLG
jgi:hypothetical protein